MLRSISKIRKAAEKDDFKESMKKEHETYLSSEEYTKWKGEYDKREDDDEVRNDPDPEGWELYLGSAGASENKEEVGLKFAKIVTERNPKEAELQAKCLQFFI